MDATYEVVGLRKVRDNKFLSCSGWTVKETTNQTLFETNEHYRNAYIDETFGKGEFKFAPDPDWMTAFHNTDDLIDALNLGEEILIVSNEDYSLQWVYVCEDEGWTCIEVPTAQDIILTAEETPS